MLTDPPAKAELRALVDAAAAVVVRSGRPIRDFRGVALHDELLDEIFKCLDTFAPAVAAVFRLRHFEERFGPPLEAERVVLQFVYEFFKQLEDPSLVTEAFEALWANFAHELDDPDWTYRAIANVRCFQTSRLGVGRISRIDLAEGVTIMGRKTADLAALGFDEHLRARIDDDWSESGFGASSFVMVVEDTVPKAPDNIVLTNLPDVWLKALRAVGALRLAAPGNVGLGRLWFLRAAKFNVGPGGIIWGGFGMPSMSGAPYVWKDDLASPVRKLYEELEQLEGTDYEKGPGNLNLALRSFMSSYDRLPSLADSQLVDSVTALEAVLGTKTESTFRLAFRVASLLAKDDGERATILREMTGFYDTRSKVVHGQAGLDKDRHQARLRDVEKLRSWVRELLSAFVHLAAKGSDAYTWTFFDQELDGALVSAIDREALRRALGLA